MLFDDSLAGVQGGGDGDEDAVCGRGLDVSLPTYEQVEQWLLSKEESAASTGLPARAETLLRWRTAFVQRLPTLLRLEQVRILLCVSKAFASGHRRACCLYKYTPTRQAASALAGRSLNALTLPATAPPRPFNALASLASRSRQYLVLTSAVELGRRSKTRGSVDLDLSEEPDSCKLSRRSARIVLQADGQFVLHNVGRRCVHYVCFDCAVSHWINAFLYGVDATAPQACAGQQHGGAPWSPDPATTPVPGVHSQRPPAVHGQRPCDNTPHGASTQAVADAVTSPTKS